MMPVILHIVTYLLLYVSGASPSSEALINAHKNAATSKTEIKAKWQEFIVAWHAQDAEACASFYAENGILIAPDFPVLEGRKPIATFYDDLFAANQSSLYRHETISLKENENDCIERGQFSVDWIRNDGTAWEFAARSLAHWVKTDDDWEIQAFIFNQGP